jgi:SH3-like domain-containing protein|tara:strand:- start:4707 stop:5153 length:447 start_codon:yes stop_codon:yes gene_type:complete
MRKKIIYFLIFFIFFLDVYSEEKYFLTLRNDEVNLRQGPSFEHPVKILYKKKYLPVLVIDISDNFRKIKDHENNSGWIHISQLSKKKAALTIKDDLLMLQSSNIYSKPLAIIKKGRLCLITKCENGWCKIKVNKFSGWIKKENLWGKL